MIIVVVDQSAEGQTRIAKMIAQFEPSDVDALDIQVSVADPQSYECRMGSCDVLILGAGLGEEAHIIARQVKELHPDIEVIMYVSQCWYSSASFRQAHLSRVRKVIPESASSLDLLQELVAIHSQFRLSGRTKKGRLVVMMQAKGGIGATTLVAALAELAIECRHNTLVWDLDIESQDLSRGLQARGVQSKIIAEWMSGAQELTHQTLRSAVTSIHPYLSVLSPPEDIAASMDLIGHPDLIKLIHRLIELASVTHDTIIVDTTGRLGPATGTLLRLADEIIVLVDDSLLGLSAAHAFLTTTLGLAKNNTHAFSILCSGTKLSIREMQEVIGNHTILPSSAWRLPVIPFDRAAASWAGTGKTLYSMGSHHTRNALETLAELLGIWSPSRATMQVVKKNLDGVGWMRTLLQRPSSVT